VLVGSGRVLRESVHILVEGMPEGVTATQVAEVMGRVPGVEDVHDLHAWTVSPGYVALSAHVVLADQALSQAQSVMDGLKRALAEEFDIEHTTIQFECESCGQGVNGGLIPGLASSLALTDEEVDQAVPGMVSTAEEMPDVHKESNR